MPTAPRRILQDAINAVPAVRYAVGIAGVAAAVAIIVSFELGPAIAVLGVVVMLVLMAALLAFARAAGLGAPDAEATRVTTTLEDRAIPTAGIVMVWVFTLLTCATGIMIFSITFFGIPVSWPELLTARR